MTANSQHPNLQDAMARCQQVMTVALAQSVPQQESELHQACLYSLLAGGKRLRPFLCMLTAELFQAPPQAWLAPACALELIHTYSLVHDDLPAMDNDDLRRGLPTCHIQYNVATAILVGDGLQAQAFAVLSQAPLLSDQQRLEMITSLANASGLSGMVYGQALDMAAEGQQLDLAQLEQLHQAKTGALIRASLRLGALCGQPSAAELELLDQYGQVIGLLYQVRDDILDVTADSETLGKTQGSDEARGKSTYVSLLGLDGARHQAQVLQQQALALLQKLGLEGSLLRQFTLFLGERPA